MDSGLLARAALLPWLVVHIDPKGCFGPSNNQVQVQEQAWGYPGSKQGQEKRFICGVQLTDPLLNKTPDFSSPRLGTFILPRGQLSFTGQKKLPAQQILPHSPALLVPGIDISPSVDEQLAERGATHLGGQHQRGPPVLGDTGDTGTV